MKKLRNKLGEVEREKVLSLSMGELKSRKDKSVIEYLKSDKRGFSDSDIDYCIDVFNIGYMPEGINKKDGSRHEFSGRLIIPLYDQYNNLKVLSSRDWRPDAYMKFFHESFDKKHYLYGLNIAKEYIKKRNKVVVVEGEFDVQSLHLKGVKTVVGCLSGNLHLNQIALLSRYCREIFIVFDKDDAGEKAIKKIQELYKEYNLQVYGLDIIPVYLHDYISDIEKVDPDLFVRRYGVKKFLESLRKSREIYKKRK